MAGSVNKVILIGNCGKDPDIRNTQDGTKIANLTIATSDSWVDKASGERKERTEWHKVVCFNTHTNEVIEKYVTKGSKLYIEGCLRTRKWVDQQGQERYSTEVVIEKFGGQLTMLSSPNGQSGGTQGGTQRQGGNQSGGSWDGPSDGGGNAGPRGKTQMESDDIPF